MIDTTHKNVHFLNLINGKIPRNGVKVQKTNSHDLCYQISKYGPEFLFGNLKIRDCIDEPYFQAKRKLLSFQIKMKTMFMTKNGRKKGNNIQIYIRL